MKRFALVLLFFLSFAYADVLFIKPNYAPTVSSPSKETVSGDVLIWTNVSSGDWSNTKVYCYYTPYGGSEQEIGQANCDSAGTWRTCNCTWSTSGLDQGDYEITVKSYLWDPINGNQLDSLNSTWVFVGAHTEVRIIKPTYAPSSTSSSKENVSNIIEISANVSSTNWDITNVTCFFSGSESGFIGYANCSGSGEWRICNCTWDMEGLDDGDYEIKVNTSSSENFTWVYADNPVWIVLNKPDEGYHNTNSLDVAWGIKGTVPNDFGNVSTDCDGDGFPEHVATNANDYTYTCTYASDGPYNVTVVSSDSKGHSRVYVRSIYIDTAKPFSDISGASPNIWHKSASLTINASDSGSGVNYIAYAVIPSSQSCSSASFSQGSPPISIDLDEGEWKICFYAVDMAGNNEDMQELSPILVDKTKPKSSINSSSAVNMWSEAVQINASFFENVSSIKSTGYKIINSSGSCPTTVGEYEKMQGNFSVDILSEGKWKICIYGEDMAGNIVFNESGPYFVDRKKPELSYDFENNTWFNVSQITLNYSVNDISLSSSAFFIWNSSWENITWISSSGSYSATFNLSDGCYWVKLNASDSLNRISEVIYKVCVDTVIPQLYVYGIVENETSGYYTSKVLHVNYTASDLNLKIVEFFVNGKEKNSTSNESGIIGINVPEGNVTVCIKAKDEINANLTCLNISVDYNGPKINIESPNGIQVKEVSQIDIIFNVRDINFPRSSCSIYLDNVKIKKADDVGGIYSFQYLTHFGSHTIKICCSDQLMHTSCSRKDFVVVSPPSSIFIPKPEKVEKGIKSGGGGGGIVVSRVYGINVSIPKLCAGKIAEIKISRPARLYVYFENRTLFARFPLSKSFSLVFPSPGYYYLYVTARGGSYKGWVEVNNCSHARLNVTPKPQQNVSVEEHVKVNESIMERGEKKISENVNYTVKTNFTKLWVDVLNSIISVNPINDFLNYLVNKIRSLFPF